MSTNSWITGLVPAVFTPMHEDGSLNLELIPDIVEHLIHDGVNGLYVCGSTGEGASLSYQERQVVAAAYVKAVAARIPVMVQVGHNSLTEAHDLAAHAQRIGADAVAAIPPSYFKPRSVEAVVQCLSKITAGAPELPFYYYHIPGITGVDFNMIEFLRLSGKQLPMFAGVKYSKTTVYELQACVDLDDGRFNMLFGSDEMLLSGLCGGAHGAVGSTYNFAAPLYHKIIHAFEGGDLSEARRLQGLSVKMLRHLFDYGGHPAFKAMMKFIGLDCGPSRLPLVTLRSDQLATLESEMEALGFFDWAR